VEHGHLWIFEELVTDEPRPELIIGELEYKLREMSQHAPITGVKKFRWYGNKLMFGLGTSGDLHDSFRKNRVYLMENDDYDEYGSISMANRMFDRGMITVHSRCEETNRQLADWMVDKKKPATMNAGLCRALCQIISILQVRGDFRPFMQKLVPYSRESQLVQDRLEQSDRNNALGEHVKIHGDNPGEMLDKDSWMRGSF